MFSRSLEVPILFAGTIHTPFTADIALAQKLGEELKYEKETANSGEPEFLTAFKAQGVWKVRTLVLSALHVGNNEHWLTRRCPLIVRSSSLLVFRTLCFALRRCIMCWSLASGLLL